MAADGTLLTARLQVEALSGFAGSRLDSVDGFRLRYALMERLVCARPICSTVHVNNVHTLAAWYPR
jgi:hypothetical protein